MLGFINIILFNLYDDDHDDDDDDYDDVSWLSHRYLRITFHSHEQDKWSWATKTLLANKNSVFTKFIKYLV